MNDYSDKEKKINEVNGKNKSLYLGVDRFVNEIDKTFSESKKYLDNVWLAKTRREIKFYLNIIDIYKKRENIDENKLTNRRMLLMQIQEQLLAKMVKHNEIVLKQLILQARSLIGVVEGCWLDDQQMQCIVKDVTNHMVVAGAGAGKTTTIVGKVKYLLYSQKYKQEDILVLSFTNASAEDMRQRIAKDTNAIVEVSTFHKLGLNIIKNATNITPKITKIQLQTFVKEQLKFNMLNSEYLNLLCRYFLQNYKFEKTEFDFKSKEEYLKYLEMNPPVTLKGELVKSYGEMDIANFLYQNGIEYEYEKEYEYDTRTFQHYQYYPDFYLPDYGVYIEYFGIDVDGNVPSFFSASHGKTASQEYKESMEWKRRKHIEKGTKLVECYSYERSRGELIENLKNKLLTMEVVFRPFTSEQIWDAVSNQNSKDILVGIAELVSTVITLLKSNEYTLEQFRTISNEKYLRYHYNLVLDIVEPIYNSYQNQLLLNDEIDFTDMINKATKLVKAKEYISPYKFVIVDEYQDISKSRYNLLKSMRKTNPYKLFCVGDDWQSIYRFTGSDLDYVLRFPKYWGITECSIIERTHRFSDSLSEISGNFIMKNPNQIRKYIKGFPSKIGFAMGEVKGYTEKHAIKFMLNRLEELPKNSSVFFIGRYTVDSKLLSECEDLECNYDNVNSEAKVTLPSRPDLKMRFLTAHRSKGLQADYVFIINNKDHGMGFPSKIQDDLVVESLLEGKEVYQFAEERRLFYVALTRARIKTFLVVVERNRSEFAIEMEQKYGQQLKQEAFSCPLCGGKLERKNGPYGEFYGCSNYRTTRCKFTRKIIKKDASSER